jgi:hypothetical protein
MGSEIRHSLDVWSWDQGQDTFKACCHGIRDKTNTPGVLSRDQGQDTRKRHGTMGSGAKHSSRPVVMGSGTRHSVDVFC